MRAVNADPEYPTQGTAAKARKLHFTAEALIMPVTRRDALVVLALVGLLAVAPIGLTALHGYFLQIQQHTPEFHRCCTMLLTTFVRVFLSARGMVSLIAIWPKRSAQLGLVRVHRYVAARWPIFGYLIGLGPRPVPGLD
ncbi:g7106 [Coccomyxa viridis]|uniref:G7106 protein n=1 Tax=Coccomyxa viridis TaxID=1274662 RepID=A0ABP1FX10_9CHLO